MPPDKKRSRSSNGLPLVAETQPRAAAAEAYRTLRTNIQFASLDQPHRILIVASASAGEGKTTTVANFGVVNAQSGLRVCVIDADLRRPALHRIFGLPNQRGLTTALLEDLSIATVVQPTRIPNLFVLTSGPSAPNPAELVGSKRMRQLLEHATTDFDLLVCDTPPIVAVADAVSLAAQCDGVIFVVKTGAVQQQVIKRTMAQIEAVKGRILGVVLNSYDVRRDGYYYDHYRYAHSYHGDGKK